jgi:hypothetical protein
MTIKKRLDTIEKASREAQIKGSKTSTAKAELLAHLEQIAERQSGEPDVASSSAAEIAAYALFSGANVSESLNQKMQALADGDGPSHKLFQSIVVYTV